MVVDILCGNCGGGHVPAFLEYICPKVYRNVPKSLDRQIWANSVDQDQTAPLTQIRLLLRVHTVCYSGSTLFAIPSASFGHITVKPSCSNFRIITAIFRMSEFYGNRRHGTLYYSLANLTSPFSFNPYLLLMDLSTLTKWTSPFVI